MSAGMTAAGLVKMAGGFKRSAYLDSAKSRQLRGEKWPAGRDGPANRKDWRGCRGRVLGRRTTQAGRCADHPADSRMERHWTLGVDSRARCCTRAITASTRARRLSALLKRVGGFLPTAYPSGAVLERTEVRELGEKGRAELIRRIELTSSTVRSVAEYFWTRHRRAHAGDAATAASDSRTTEEPASFRPARDHHQC